MTDTSPTQGFVMNQTMMRIRDPKVSVDFYRDVLGMTLLQRFDFESMSFSLYFMGYLDDGESIPEDPTECAKWVFAQPALVELTHNWGDNEYDLGNAYGHIAIGVDDAYAFCDNLKKNGVEVVREPGPMKHGTTVIAFAKDPDGYMVELIQP